MSMRQIDERYINNVFRVCHILTGYSSMLTRCLGTSVVDVEKMSMQDNDQVFWITEQTAQLSVGCMSSWDSLVRATHTQ